MLANLFLPEPLRSWNTTLLDEDHALRFCKHSKVHVVMDRMQEYGKYVFYKGHPFILINPALDAGMRLWVLWHEIAHFLLHTPTTDCFSSSMKRKRDNEANYFAAIAMMPAPLLVGLTINEVERRFGYPREIVEIRYEIYEREGI